MFIYLKKIKCHQFYLGLFSLLATQVYAQDASPQLGVEYDEVKQISIAGLDVSKKITHAQASKILGKANIKEIEGGEGDKVEYSTLIVPYKKANLFYKIPWEGGFGNQKADYSAYKKLLNKKGAFYTELSWRNGDTYFPQTLLINNTPVTKDLSQKEFVERFTTSARHPMESTHDGEAEYRLSLCPYDPKLEAWVDVPYVWFTFAQNKLVALEYSAGSCDLNNNTDDLSNNEWINH